MRHAQNVGKKSKSLFIRLVSNALFTLPIAWAAGGCCSIAARPYLKVCPCGGSTRKASFETC
eukprot:1157707-Pelagomonas_calceolata.AAC.6